MEGWQLGLIAVLVIGLAYLGLRWYVSPERQLGDHAAVAQVSEECRVFSVTTGGGPLVDGLGEWTFEPDPRHAELIPAAWRGEQVEGLLRVAEVLDGSRPALAGEFVGSDGTTVPVHSGSFKRPCMGWP